MATRSKVLERKVQMKILNKIKEFLIGTSIFWLPIVGIGIANQLCIWAGLGSL